MGVFADRADAGRRLAARLQHLRGQDLVVLGVPRGGVPVAFEVAEDLGAPLDVIVVRKLGMPFQPELAMGAICEGGFRALDRDLLAQIHMTDEGLRSIETRERAELDARVARLRRGRAPHDLTGRVAVVVDDGIATGASARVACQAARHLGAARVVLAVPVAPADSLGGIAEADEIVCVSTPAPFLAVGYHYQDFSPTSDDEVVSLLETAARRTAGRGRAPDTARDCDIDVRILLGPRVLQAPPPAHVLLLRRSDAPWGQGRTLARREKSRHHPKPDE